MASWLVLSEEERSVDPQLGYPRGYAKLCRHAHAWVHTHIFPYSEGPPRKFSPYALPSEDIAKLKDFENLFPVIDDDSRDTLNVQRYGEMLWRQLDHLGNAGFDPAKFRVDPYGNVLYWNADPASPLAWEVAHWFPHSRGGKSVLNNLRLVQWQVSLRMRNSLEFLVPWWDLQLGVSVNHFLSAFASTNVEFRRRCFAYLFQSGEDEQISDKLIVENHHWPNHFLEKKSRCGLAAAALVRQQRDVDDVLRSLNGPRPGSLNTSNYMPGSLSQKKWSLEEEEALKRAVLKFGFGSWKEIKNYEPALMHHSTVSIRDKCRSMRKFGKEGEKENMRSDPSDKQSTLTSVFQKESRMQQLREEEKQDKSGEVAQLEEKLKAIKEQNEKEKEALETLECMLMQQRKQVEKQQQWNETQASYRLCLERMVHEAMHQSVIYKEEARLNQAACNSLMAQLESLTATCGAAEADFLKRSKQRELLLSLIHKNLSNPKEALNKGNILPYSDNRIDAPPQQIDLRNSVRALRRKPSGKRHRLRVDPDKCSGMKASSSSSTAAADLALKKDEQDAKRPKQEDNTNDTEAIMATEEEHIPLGNQQILVESTGLIPQEEVVLHNSAAAECSKPDAMNSLQQKNEEEQLDDLLQEVLVMQGKINEDFDKDDISEEDKLRLLGKNTLDKWLQILLVRHPEDLAEEEQQKVKVTTDEEVIMQHSTKEEPLDNEIVEIVEAEMDVGAETNWADEHNMDRLENQGCPQILGPTDDETHTQNSDCFEKQESAPKGREEKKNPLGGLFRKLSVRHHHQHNEVRSSKRNGQQSDAESVASGDWDFLASKMAAMRIESSAKPKEANEATVTKIIKRAISPFSRKKSSKTENVNPQHNLIPKQNYQPMVGVSNDGDGRLDPRQQASMKACAQASRRASVTECAETWKNDVRRLESRKQYNRQYY